MTAAVTFAAVFAALFAAHSVGDHWVQTHHQACAKGAPTTAGRIACARHVATLTAVKTAALTALALSTGLALSPWAAALGLAVDALSHYWADRSAYHADRKHSVTLERLGQMFRKGGFYQLGDRLIAPTGTGAYALDQSWHVGWLFITALIIAGGA